MKKALSALLVLTMAGCLSLSSFALEETVTSVTDPDNKSDETVHVIDTATKNGVTASLQNPNFDLTTGEGLTPETADSDTITVSVSGTPTTDTDFDIGTITVAITANPQP